MKSISPNIFVNDLQATITFYTKLGFTITHEVATAEGEKVFAMMTNGSGTFMFQSFASIEGKHPMVSRADGGSLLLYISVDNIRLVINAIIDKTTEWLPAESQNRLHPETITIYPSLNGRLEND